METSGQQKTTLIDAIKKRCRGTDELKRQAQYALRGRTEIDKVAWDRVSLDEAAFSLVNQVAAEGKIDDLVRYFLANESGSVSGGGGSKRIFADGRIAGLDAVDPTPVFERVGVRKFTGRAWLQADLDRFITENPKGYYIIEGRAGMGKTAFLAHLVRERGYVHHFPELGSSIDAVFHNLTAQLNQSWGLDRYTEAVNPESFRKLLFEIAKMRDIRDPSLKIVIIVDALDEIQHDGTNSITGLPRTLPGGVFLVASKRPVHLPLKIAGPRHFITLAPNDPRNLEDLGNFVKDSLLALKQSGCLGSTAVDQLTTSLLKKSEGVWIYVFYVLNEIERGTRSADDLEGLPTGLLQFYAEFWLQWKHNHLAEWSHDIRLLGTLAAVEIPIDLKLLCEFSELQDCARVSTVLGNDWSPFLGPPDASKNQFRLPHASLRDFALGQGDAESLPEQERLLCSELACATREAHARIADRYLKHWGGIANGLPGLHDVRIRRLDDGYGLYHVCEHLARAGSDQVLDDFLRVQWPTAQPKYTGWLRGKLKSVFRLITRHTADAPGCVNAWAHTLRQEGMLLQFCTDVEHALSLSRQRAYSNAEQSGSGNEFPRAIRYGLMLSSVRTSAGTWPHQLLAATLRHGLCTPEQAVTDFIQTPRLWKQQDALRHVMANVSDRDLSRVLKVVEDSAHVAGSGSIMAEFVTIVAVRGEYKMAEDAAYRIAHAGYRALALCAVGNRIPEGKRPSVFDAALHAAEQVSDRDRMWFWPEIANALPDTRGRELALRALGMVQNVSDLAIRAQRISVLLTVLSRDDLDNAISQVIADLDSTGDIRTLSRIAALSHLLMPLAGFLPETVIRRWITYAASGSSDQLAVALSAIRPFLRTQELQENALELVDACDSIESRRRALQALAQGTVPAIAERIFRSLKDICTNEEWAYALAKIALYIPIEHISGEISWIREVVREPELRARTLAALAQRSDPGLASKLFQNALDAIDEKHHLLTEFDRADFLSTLLPTLPRNMIPRARESVLALKNLWSIECPHDTMRALAGIVSYIPAPELENVKRFMCASLQGRTRVAYHRPSERRRVLELLVPRLTAKQVADIAAAARQISDQPWRVAAIAAMIPDLPALQQQSIVREAVQLQPRWLKDLFVEIVSRWPAGRAGELLDQVLTTSHVRTIEALTDLVPKLDPPLKWQAIGELDRLIRYCVKVDYVTTETMRGVPCLSEQQVNRLVRIVGRKREVPRAEAFRVLAPAMSTFHQATALQHILRIAIPEVRAEALSALLLHLKDNELQTLVRCHLKKTLRLVRDGISYWRVIGEVGHFLEPSIHQILDTARNLKDARERAIALSSIAVAIGRNSDLTSAAAIAEKVESDEVPRQYRESAFTRLAQVALQSRQPELMLDLIGRVSDAESRSECLKAAIPILTQSLTDRAIELAHEIDNIQYRAEALALLTRNLTEPSEQQRIARRALEDAAKADKEGTESLSWFPGPRLRPTFSDIHCSSELFETDDSARDAFFRTCRCFVLETIASVVAADREFTRELFYASVSRISLMKRAEAMSELRGLCVLLMQSRFTVSYDDIVGAIRDVASWWP